MSGKEEAPGVEHRRIRYSLIFSQNMQTSRGYLDYAVTTGHPEEKSM